MRFWIAVLVCFFLSPYFACAQTRDDAVTYIVDEFKSFESREYKYTEVAFSPSGDAFTLRRKHQDNKDYVLTFNLKDVDIYKVTVNHPNGINLHQLMVRPRGPAAGITRDGATFKGAVKMSPATENEPKILALERAFARMTELATGRKLFPAR